MALAFEKLAAAIRRGEVAPVYTLAGEDLLQQREVLAALRERVPDIGRQVLDGATCSAGEIVAALRTAGFVPGRLVVVEEPRWMLPPRRAAGRSARGRPARADARSAPDGGEDAEGALGEGGDAVADDPATEGPGSPAPAQQNAEQGETGGDERALLAYIDRPATDAVLVLRATAAVDRRRRLTRRAAERGVQLLTVPPAPAEAARWIQERARGLGLPLDRASGDLVAARLEGATCERIDSELRKLAAWAQGTVLDREALDRLLPASREERVFDLLDAAVLGQGARALALGAALRAQGEPVPLLLFLLAKQLRSLVLVADACRDGSRPEEAAGRLGLHPFVARKALQQSRHFSPGALAAAWDAVWGAEFAFKSGRLDEDRALDQALLGVLRAQATASS